MTELALVGGVLALMLGVMNVAWLHQKLVANTGWVDVYWTFGTGLCGIAVALWPLPGAAEPNARQLLIAVLVAVWALRLGGYIARRVASTAEDARYVKLKADWGAAYDRRLFWFVQPQAAATAILCLSILVAARNPRPELGLQDWLGAAILAFAILGERLADQQLTRFKASGAPHGAICEVGLWGWSRHPNYFFQWLGWLAWPVIAADFTGAYPHWWLSLAGAFAMYAILRFLTGVPPLERTMEASRGQAFRDYQRRVSAFFPMPPKSRLTE